MNAQSESGVLNCGIAIDKDVDVPMRDGARLKADVFRPDVAGRYPAILNLGPYQKDKPWIPPDTLEEKPNPHMNWETVNPEWWVPRGYACVRVDGRGSGKSPGQCEPWSPAEAVDFYDAIEWAAAQPWCNGKVGLNGISYYAINQWFVANLQPPSLHAIIPWEGFADLYRDALFHGGILSVFMTNWFTAHLMHHAVGRASQNIPNAWQTNTLHFWVSNSLDSGAFRGSQAQWDKITVPFFSVGNWTGMALHLRGNTEAFMRAASPHKKLRIQTGSHVHPFYTEEGRRDQLRFLDCWLKDIDNGVVDEPPVKLAIRKGRDEIEWRHEHEWPLARTQWTKFYFDLAAPAADKPHNAGGLTSGNPDRTASVPRCHWQVSRATKRLEAIPHTVTPPAPPAPGQKLYGIELFRFGAALAVLFAHYNHFYHYGLEPESFTVTGQPLFKLFQPFYQYGTRAVEISW